MKIILPLQWGHLIADLKWGKLVGKCDSDVLTPLHSTARLVMPYSACSIRENHHTFSNAHALKRGTDTLAASRETITNEMLRKSYKSFLQVMSSQHMLGPFKLQHPFLVPSITGYRSRANMHHECDLLQRASCVWMLLLQTTQIWGR
jgi:hypothetical protein